MEWFDQAIETARDRAQFRVAALRLSHPGEDQVSLGRRLVESSALRAGLAGAATGSLSLVALPLGLPAGMAVALLVEAELIFALLELYELETAGEAGRLKLSLASKESSWPRCTSTRSPATPTRSTRSA